MAGALTPTGLIQKWNAATISFNTLFQQVLAGTEVTWNKVADEVPSDTREETYAWLDRIPAIREWIGARVVNSTSIRQQTLVNKTYEDTLGIPREAVEDDKIGVYKGTMTELSRQAAEWPDYLVSQAMINGHTALSYDGQNFFDTDHPVNMDDSSVTDLDSNTTQSNYLTSTALNADNLKTAIETMKTWVGADGRPLRIRPDLLVVPSALEMTARELIQMKFIFKDLTLTGGTHGATFTENVLQGSLRMEVWPFLDAEPTSWYLLCTTRGLKPFIFQLRIPPEFATLTSPEAHNVFSFNEFLYGFRCRGVAGYGAWFTALKGTS